MVTDTRRNYASTGCARLALCLLMLGSANAHAEVVDFLGGELNYLLNAAYALGVRVESKNSGVINTAGRSEVPISEELKFPESNNFDDGDRNFDKYSLVNNRLTLFGELQYKFNDDFGALVRGDAFYDDVYNSSNDNDAPDRLNTRQQPPDSFTDSADYFSGNRARILDAYVYGNFEVGERILSLNIGKHLAAWGQSLFFSGVALAQATADATKATVPGADVKSILLPINQISGSFTLTENITLLAQYRFEYRPFELNPAGEYFSVADIIGPGADFAYGIRNPFDPATLAQFDLTNGDSLADIIMTVNQATGNMADTAALEDLLSGTLGPLVLDSLPPVTLPLGQLGNPLNVPTGLNPERLADTLPRDSGQYGLGLRYALNFTTQVGFFHLNYHNTTPAPVQIFGDALLIPEQRDPVTGTPLTPAVFTSDIGLQEVPVAYTVKYFDDVKLWATSFSSVFLGANIGGEFIYRDGIDVLVDAESGIAGPVPTPTRADSYQVLLNAIYLINPRLFWDSFVLVGEIGYIHVNNVEPVPSQAGPNQGMPNSDLTFDDNAAAFALLAMIDNLGVFPGWDMRIPISVQGQVYNRSAVAGAFGSLLGEDDYRFGIGVEFTRLQKLTLGLLYSGFIGGADFLDRPLQDRDTVSLIARYNFF